MESASNFIWVAIFCAIAALVFVGLYLRAKRQAQGLADELSSAKSAFDGLKSETDHLRKYEQIVDAEASAIQIRQDAQSAATSMTDRAKTLLEEAERRAQARLDDADTRARTRLQNAEERASTQLTNAEAQARAQLQSAEEQVKSIMAEARREAKEARERGQAALEDASRQSNTIIEGAKVRAQEIAGAAMEAKGKADLYEQTAKAMKNVIDGYGDEYIIPSRSILDDLAEDFGHKEAGQKLKEARSHTKAMIKSGLAADCDYVEVNRRTYAIQFVLDAFNGKVDSALSKVRHDNYGKLRQEILDAFNLVNFNGKAFREARVRQQFLEARLDELKWAVATYKLQVEEREEQRRIQEAIREEERARREYEKAIKEAEKEERMLQKAMDEAKKQLSAASAEQRQQFEQQLAELEQRLKEAEEKNQRALSMAQQTRRGHVYIISNIGSFGEHIYKVGLTRRLEPLDRIRELGDASVPFPFDIHAMIYAEDAPALETSLHRLFEERQVNRVNPRKEFFRVGIAEIRQAVEERGMEAHWTMAAEAQEYRESLAMEAAGKVAAYEGAQEDALAAGGA